MAARLPIWTWIWPLLGWAILLAPPFLGSNSLVAVAVGAVLIGTVFAVEYHAEVVASRTGEPLGTLLLAVAVTVIEVSLIVSSMIGAPAEKAGLARDTVFAVVMIACNGVMGLCLLWGGMRHHQQDFKVEGASAALAVLTALTTLTLILPNVERTSPGPQFSTSQLMFSGVVSLVLYGSFIFIQTVRHRDHFLHIAVDEEVNILPTSNRTVAVCLGFLLGGLLAVVGLAKALTPTLASALSQLNEPKAAVGVIIATLIMLPEGLAAVRAARDNRLQTSLNTAMGSALASIGLTIPAVAIVSVVLRQPIELGLGRKETVLLALTLLTAAVTLGTGRTTVIQGVVHLVIFAVFLFFAIVP